MNTCLRLFAHPAIRWGLGLILAVVLPIGALLSWGAWTGPQQGTIITVTQARLSFSRALNVSTGYTPTETQVVALPHVWTLEQHQMGTWAHYDVDVPSNCDGVWAIAVPNHMPDLRLISATHELEQMSLTGRWNQVVLADLPLCEKNNAPSTVRISVAERFAWQGGVGQIWIGPKAAVTQRAWVVSSVRAVANHLVVGVLMSFAILGFFGWILRPSPLLAWVFAAGLLAAIRQGLFTVFGTWAGDDMILALMILSTQGSICAACMVILTLAQQRWQDLAVWIVLGTLVLACVLYVPWGSVGERRWLGNGVVTPVLGLTLARSIRPIWQRRDWLLMALLLTMSVQWLMFSRSLFPNGNRLPFELMNNASLLSPAIAVVIGLAMAHRLHKAFLRYETLTHALQVEVHRYKIEVDERSQREQALAVRAAGEAERTRWMQEIHDGLGSHLIGTRFLSDKLPLQPGLAEVKASVDEAIEQLRMLVESLSPVPASVPSLLGTLRYRVTPKLEAAGLRIAWDVDLSTDTDELSPVVALNVQRIVQEALTNVLKHAKATELRVLIRPAEGGTLVQLEDNGIGFDPLHVNRGQGLANMLRRAVQCSASLTWTQLAQGTQINLIIKKTTSTASTDARSRMTAK